MIDRPLPTTSANEERSTEAFRVRACFLLALYGYGLQCWKSLRSRSCGGLAVRAEASSGGILVFNRWPASSSAITAAIMLWERVRNFVVQHLTLDRLLMLVWSG